MKKKRKVRQRVKSVKLLMLFWEADMLQEDKKFMFSCLNVLLPLGPRKWIYSINSFFLVFLNPFLACFLLCLLNMLLKDGLRL